MKQEPPSDRTRVRRSPERARHDAATLHAILDEALLCHVAFSDEHGAHCLPTACWRVDGHLVIHGSNGSRLLRRLAEGADACVAVTHLDGLVLARSAFNHSMNYRSAMVYGRFEVVPPQDKAALLDAFMDRLVEGRRHEARPGDANELAATTLLRLPLDEAVCKMRQGGPEDDEADLGLDVWAGVLPVAMHWGPALPDGVENVRRVAPSYAGLRREAAEA